MNRVLIGIPVLDNLPMTRARAYLQCFFRHTDNKRQPLDITLLLIDNGSKEDVPGLLRDEFSSVSFPIYYRRNPTNLGVAVEQILRPAWLTSQTICPVREVEERVLQPKYHAPQLVQHSPGVQF
jgi:hypothetical protein